MSDTRLNRPSIPAEARPRNPYVGPRTFSEADARYFFGREREARDLLSLVISEPLVLFYAQSGAGKSSLLHARLIPALREEEFEVLPIGRVAGGLPAEGLRPSNIFIYNLLLSIDNGRTPPAQLAQFTLLDYIAQRRATLEPQTALVLIVDQFEEILTTHVARWQEREAFFQQLGQALREDSLLWVVLSLRDDYVAALDPFAQHVPNKFRGRFYMQRMTTEAALQAIERPAAGAGRPFAPGVAQTLVHNLAQIRTRTGEVAGEFVQPVQMQVVCFQLWENLARTDLPQITAEALRDLGDVNTALSQFYEQSLSATAQATGIPPKRLRDWFTRELITDAGTRGLVFQGNTETGGLPNAAVADLEKRYLIRGEWRGGNLWYELTHDRFIEPIQKANEAWYAARRARWVRWATTAAGSLVLLLLIVAAGLYLTRPTTDTGVTEESVRTTVVAVQEAAQVEAEATVSIYQQDAALAQTRAAEVAMTATADGQIATTIQAQLNAEATVAAATAMAQVSEAQATAEARATAEFAIAATATSQSAYLVTIAQAVQEQSTISDPNVVEAIAQTTFTTMDSQTRLDSLSSLLFAEQTTYDVPLTSYAASAADLFNGLSSEEQINLFATTDVNGQRTLLELAMRRTLRLVGNNDTDLLGAMLAAASQTRINIDLAAVLDSWWNGRISAESGQYDVALRLFDAALLAQPDNPILLMDRARAYAETGQIQNALNDYLAALGYLNVVVWDGETLSCTGQSQTEGDMVALLGRAIFDQPAVWESLQVLEARYPLMAAVARPLFTELPLDVVIVTQEFGANEAVFQPLGLPGHDGLDFAGQIGEAVYAVADGVVVAVQSDPSRAYGLNITVEHQWGCLTYQTRYAQLSEIDVALNEVVEAGERVGQVGQTGNAVGPHLHLGFMARPYSLPDWPNDLADPSPYIAHLIEWQE
ncbi:MAG: peptidoglycan DD-metalloendopeptidase family protein [Chloroflexi bacterium]|nr:peptidoglycan DD-metalloendopeptidase family protein [Chloroflexota bacterium]